LGLDDLGQSERVIGFTRGGYFGGLGVRRQGGLRFSLLLPQSFALRLQAGLKPPHFAIVLLQHVGGLYELPESLLVEAWVFVRIGHNRS
jgi:hypothetical protein